MTSRVHPRAVLGEGGAAAIAHNCISRCVSEGEGVFLWINSSEISPAIVSCSVSEITSNSHSYGGAVCIRNGTTTAFRVLTSYCGAQGAAHRKSPPIILSVFIKSDSQRVQLELERRCNEIRWNLHLCKWLALQSVLHVDRSVPERQRSGGDSGTRRGRSILGFDSHNHLIIIENLKKRAFVQ